MFACMYGMYVKGYTSLLIKANSNQRQPSDLASCCLRERLHSATQLKVNESTTYHSKKRVQIEAKKSRLHRWSLGARSIWKTPPIHRHGWLGRNPFYPLVDPSGRSIHTLNRSSVTKIVASLLPQPDIPSPELNGFIRFSFHLHAWLFNQIIVQSL